MLVEALERNETALERTATVTEQKYFLHFNKKTLFNVLVG
jgi:hypothetical protein